MNIIVTGGTGLIGSRIVQKLINRGDQVTILTQSEKAAKQKLTGAAREKWTPGTEGDWEKIIDGKDGVIHLAGASIFGKRWNEEYKNNIMKSREESTRSIVNAIAKAKNKPAVLVSASAVGYYGKDTGEVLITESAPSGSDFLARVCQVWEKQAANVEAYDVRRVSLRTGVVLDKHEGALQRMILQFRLFSGGPLGSGKQWFSWIHIDDLSDVYLRALDDNTMQGSINATSPHPVRMKEMAKTLGSVMHRPDWLRIPAWLMEIVLGESVEFILGGQKVIPAKLLKSGYIFKYPKMREALEEILKSG